MNIFLASSSRSRMQLLRDAGVVFDTISHTSTEDITFTGDPLEYVQAIAADKIAQVVLPSVENGEQCVVLAADTVAHCQETGEILGKPHDRDDAKRMVRLMRRQTISVVTACIVEHRQWANDTWHIREREEIVVPTTLMFDVPEEMLDAYLDADNGAALRACGGAVLETFGGRFLHSLNGSYSAVLGLPLYEVCDALTRLGVL